MTQALRLSAELAELRELEQFPARVTDVMRELIPCEHCGYNAIDLETADAIVVANPDDVVFDGGPQTLARLGHQNPLIVRALAGDLTVQKLSEHITSRQLHRTELYHEIYRRISLEYQLGVQLPNVEHSLGGARQFVGLSLARHHRDFSQADKLMLELLRPHFAATLERLHQLALTRAVLAGLRADDDRWIVLVDNHDVVAWASEGAEQALGARAGERLQLDQQFAVRRVPDAHPELDALHIARGLYLDAAALRQLGLTTRQSEVLELAVRGLSAQQIADTLILSRRTIEKHFEAIYAHLGVNTRAQAVAATNAQLRSRREASIPAHHANVTSPTRVSTNSA
ncbi:MAG TPA: LuxR C-terminal-related transcriptional regulator [Solirubrobacteraceae bacterium]|nr:LuxR C-terminal-related transcriptional regulator [Solirubrobacteraceae bacterium]